MRGFSHFNTRAVSFRANFPPKQHPATLTLKGHPLCIQGLVPPKAIMIVQTDIKSQSCFSPPSDRKQLIQSFQSIYMISISRWSFHTWHGIVCCRSKPTWTTVLKVLIKKGKMSMHWKTKKCLFVCFRGRNIAVSAATWRKVLSSNESTPMTCFVIRGHRWDRCL